MLKECLVLALTALCLAQAVTYNTRTADMDFLHKQKKIYELFFYVNQDLPLDSEIYQIGHSYNIEMNFEYYSKIEYPQEYLKYFQYYRLKRGAIFTPYYKEQREEAEMLFKLFYYAKDFQTFYKTACWARLYANEGLFVYSLTTAVYQRPDCRGIRLPAPYEIFPNLFFDSKVIYDAFKIKMAHGYKALESSSDSYLIYANYTGEWLKPYNDYEYKMDYYFEDVALNSYYYYYRMVYPFWLNSKEYNIPFERRGDMYYYVHQQLLARYYLERLSNGLGEIEDFDWYKPIQTGYYSNLVYPNGVSMPQRDYWNRIPVYKYKYVKEYEALEFRILSAIDLGYIYDKSGKQISIYTPEGFNYLGNIIEGNYDSSNYKYYGSVDALCRDIFGFGYDSYNKNYIVPGALQSYSTSMRDPAFYRMYKKIMYYFYRYKQNLPIYTKEELSFSGVKFEGVNFDQQFLTTYFDYCDYFINNAVTVGSFKEGLNFRIKARQYCLNYKPFTYKFTINSDKDTKAMLRIFLGPYMKEGLSYLPSYYMNFVELDQFTLNLKQGVNNYEHRSTDSVFTMNEQYSGYSFYKKIQNAIEGNEPYAYSDKFYGFPQRLYLPKGTKGGMKYTFFFYLSPLDESKSTTYEYPYYGKIYANKDSKPWGFPLDRPMYPSYFTMPNFYFKDFSIYHQKEYQKSVYPTM